MPRPCSAEPRERALLACEEGTDGCAQVARRFRTGISTLHLRRKQARNEGRRAPRPLGRGPAALGGRLDALVAERNGAALAEHAGLLAARTGERRSPAAICRALKRLGGVRKQGRCGPAGRVARTWRDEAANSDPARFVFLGEGGFDTRLTLLGAPAPDGACAAMTATGATGSAVFLAFVTQVPVPALKRTRPTRSWSRATWPPAGPPPCAARWTRPGSAAATCPPVRRTCDEWPSAIFARTPSSKPGPS